jgi:hypothetical protein
LTSIFDERFLREDCVQLPVSAEPWRAQEHVWKVQASVENAWSPGNNRSFEHSADVCQERDRSTKRETMI